jgi:thiol-disulfide isomerase/thioredoxin
MQRSAPAIFATVLVATVGLAALVVPHRTPSSPTTLPALRASAPERLGLASIDGRDAVASRPARLRVINVWATWCAPCRAELPSLQRLADATGGSGIDVLGISVDRDADFVREYLRDVRVRYPNLIDPEQRVAQPVLGATALPYTVLVDSDGRVLRRIVGVHEWDAPEIRAEIAALAATPPTELGSNPDQ